MMPNDPNAPSSDLERARAISRALRPEGAPRAAKPQPQPPTGYITFRAAAAPADSQAAVSSIAAPTAAEPPPAINGYGVDAWKALLAWASRVASAEEAFLIDPQGLMIAHLGAMPAEEIEVKGARLQMALEQAQKLRGEGEPAPSVSIALGNMWLNGFLITLNGAGGAILGLLGPEAIGAEQRRAVERGFAGL